MGPYDGNKWVEFSTTSSVAYCPKYTQPSIIYYNDLVYIFGQDFSSIYVSNQGLFWKKANPKFSSPIEIGAKEELQIPM